MSMPLNVLAVPVEEAQERLKIYRQAVRSEHRDMDRKIAAGYLHISKGRQVILLAESIKRAGFDDRGMPRLAVAPGFADKIRVSTGVNWLRGQTGTELIFTVRHPRDMRSADQLVGDDYVRVPMRQEVTLPRNYEQLRAIVPVVPPEHRVPGRNLNNFHILFEAEWQVDPVAPKDPALIKHIEGDLWAVYATWDLTELERAVLSGR